MPTVYVFGAGASRDAGYPLASEMGGALFEYMRKSENVSIRASAEFLIDNFGETPSIEDLITEIESQVARLKNSEVPEDRVQRSRMGNRRGYLGVALQEWFREIHLSPAPSYATFADQIVRPGDVVITFNYDDSLEGQLRRFGKWDISRGYGFSLGMENISSDVLVLKLHGSVNWLVSLFGGATSGAFLVNPPSSMGNHPVIHGADLKFLGYETFAGHTYQSGAAFPCLILPGRSKGFFYDTSFGHEFDHFWDHLWSLAAKALKAANKIVICGYSLPSADQRARDLLFRQPQRKATIQIISGDQSERIASEFSDAGFESVSTFTGGYFANWCQVQQGSSATATQTEICTLRSPSRRLVVKGYVSFLKLIKDGEDWREDVSFDSHAEKAMYWESRDDADIKCQEFNRGVKIQSVEGGDHWLQDFRVEETEPGKFSIHAEGPFIMKSNSSES